MIVYRMAHRKFINDLSGYGAYLLGGRWSLKGLYALYTAEHKSLAYLEYLVHQFERDTWPKNIHIATLRVKTPESIVTVNRENLPPNWNNLEYHVESQLVASRYFNQQALGIKVPSVIVPGESNFVFNPLHKNFHSCLEILETEAVEFDKRFQKAP